MMVFIFGVEQAVLHSSMCRWKCLCKDILESLHLSDLCLWKTPEMIVWSLADGQTSLKTLNVGGKLWRVLTSYDGVRKNWNLKLACAYADNQPGSPSTYFWLKIGRWNWQTQNELLLAQMSEAHMNFLPIIYFKV